MGDKTMIRGFILACLSTAIFAASIITQHPAEAVHAAQEGTVRCSNAKPVMVPYLDMDIDEYKALMDLKHLSICSELPEASENAAVLRCAGTFEENIAEEENAGTEAVCAPAEEPETDPEEYPEEPEAEEDPDPPEGQEDAGPIYLGEWTITAYCPCPECCGEWATGYTASGTLATAGHTAACNVLDFGTQILIDGIVYTIEDTGYSPYGDAWIDIFFNSHEEALAYGTQVREVYLLPEG